MVFSRLRIGILVGSCVFAAAAVLAAVPREGLAQPEIPFPANYGGKVLIMGEPAAKDTNLVACIEGCDTGYQSQPAVIPEAGRYVTLTVAPETRSFEGGTLIFHIVNEFGSIQADETATYNEPKGVEEFVKTLDLNFPEPLPTAPLPTPTATPPPTPTLLPTPFLPIPGDTSVSQVASIALVAGIASLLVGGAILLLMRRRRAF